MTQKITFIEKYALLFYAPAISNLITFTILYHYPNISFVLAYTGAVNPLCYFLIPMKDDANTHFSKELNNSKWPLIPLIVSCISTPLILAYCWCQYDSLVNSFSDGLTFVLFMTITSVGSILGSHELLHRPEVICKVFSFMNLFFFQFTAYPIQHLYLHHKKVGSPEDPITAPKNENVYRYYVRAIVSAYKFNYHYSKKIFAICILSTLSYMLIVILLALREGSGIGKIMAFILYSYVSLLLMEAVEYIEHYGLIYRTSEKAKPVTQTCSWNASINIVSNFIGLRFERHSDHHMNAYKLYNTMDITDKMPQFPFDFLMAANIAFIPFLWKWIANPLVDEVIEGKKVPQSHLKNISYVFNGLRIYLLMSFFIKFI